MSIISSYLKEFVGIINEMAPYLLLGFFFAGLLHVIMPNEKVIKYLGGKNYKSVFNAALLGVPLPLCSCGVIPTGLSFYKNGASKGSAVSFLISTPQTGIDSIMVTYSMIGLPFALLRPVIAFVTGIAGGVTTNRLTINEADAEKKLFGNEEKQDHSNNKLFEIFRYAFVEFIQDIAKWLIIGILVAAFISVIIPDGFFTSYLNYPLLSMLLVLIASIPLYVCATGSVPIAAVLMMKGLSPGAALVFLMAGPATNAATITMVGKVMGRKALYGYLGSIIGGALIFGLFIDYFLPASWFTMMVHHHSHEEMVPLWLQIFSSVTLGLLLLNALRLRYFRKNKVETPNLISAMEIKTIQVQGMTCNHCKATVEKGIRGIEGIKDVNIDLQQGKVMISADTINLEEVKSTVEGLGYKYAGEV